jgi:hypothetical protein
MKRPVMTAAAWAIWKSRFSSKTIHPNRNVILETRYQDRLFCGRKKSGRESRPLN